jgi:predicted ATPase
MITRLYANNYRCLVAFEAQFDSFNVLCGPNGAGKSSVFDALRVLRDLASADIMVDDQKAVKYREHTNWLDSKVVEFEMDMRAEGCAFNYRLHIEQVADSVKPRIIEEQATCDGKTLFVRDLEGVRFQKASGAQKGFPLDWRQAALGSIQPAADRREIEILQQALGRVLIIRPNPLEMENESKEENARPDLHLSNLTSWYRFLSQEQEWTDHLRNALQGVWPDFRSFRLVSTGLQAKALQLRFEPTGSPESGDLFIDQLSDGEKMLVGLYMIQSALATGAVQTMLIDEPDNFVGLPELQPWVTSLMELLEDDTQAIVISHHPEILNTAGEQFGRYLWRDNHTSPTRIGPLRAIEGLSIGEAIARGWVNA